MSGIHRTTREYYEKRLETASHIEYLVFDGEEFASCGSMSSYDLMPTYSNHSGRKGYVMNRYTRPNCCS